jgi:hypothetical protein
VVNIAEAWNKGPEQSKSCRLISLRYMKNLTDLHIRQKLLKKQSLHRMQFAHQAG